MVCAGCRRRRAAIRKKAVGIKLAAKRLATRASRTSRIAKQRNVPIYERKERPHMETPTQLLKIRKDAAGSGEFGSSRDSGTRTHSGVDYISKPDSQVLTPVSGRISKLGYPYADDLSYRYVQITDEEGNAHRLFYVKPGKDLVIGQQVTQYDPIGTAQDVSRRYPDRGMTPHVHYEIKNNLGKFIDPTHS